jgi:hypothetical protein
MRHLLSGSVVKLISACECDLAHDDKLCADGDSRIDCPRCLALMKPKDEPKPFDPREFLDYDLQPIKRRGIDPTAHPCRGSYTVTP